MVLALAGTLKKTHDAGTLRTCLWNLSQHHCDKRPQGWLMLCERWRSLLKMLLPCLCKERGVDLTAISMNEKLALWQEAKSRVG